MEESDLYAGVDAGGTRTRLVLADAAGRQRSAVEGGPGNYQRLGAADLGRLVADLLQRAAPGRPPAVLCAGVAGAGRPAEQEALQQELERLGVAHQVVVVSDARAALEGAHGGDPGIVCIAGTGSMVLGRNAAGDEARAGGWGPALGDEGSAYWLALAGVRRALHAVDGSGPPTRLEADLLAALDLADWREVIAGVYGGRLTRERIAEACPAVFAAARAGDVGAAEVIDAGGRALGRQIAGVARRLRLEPPVAVACSGGVFAELDALRPALEAGAGGLPLVLAPPRLSGCLGALRLAMAAGGVRLPAEALEDGPPA